MVQNRTLSLVGLAAWAILFVVCGLAQAVDHYVTVTGAGSHNGTAGNEYTITEGVSAAQPGDTVYIHAGTYTHPLICVRSGSGPAANQIITFRAYPGDECQGTYGGAKTATVTFQSMNEDYHHSGIKIYPYDYIRVEGVAIVPGASDWSPALYIGDSGDSHDCIGIQIVNCKLSALGVTTGIGAYTVNAQSCLVENCEVGDTTLQNAILVDGTNNTFRANYIHGNGSADGISISGSGHLVELNTICDSYTNTGAHQDAIVATYLENTTIRYNTLHDFHSCLIYLASTTQPSAIASNVYIYGNVCYNTPGKGACPGISIDHNNNDATVSNVQIFHNTIGYCGPGESMLKLRSKSGTTVGAIKIRDNLFVGWGAGIDNSLYSSTTVDMDYSLWAQTSGKQTINGGGSHDIVVVGDPGLTNYDKTSNFDFRLLTGSGAKDTGDPALASVVTLPASFVDILNVIRPSGTGYDIGAYEFDAGAATNHAPVLAAIGAKSVNEGSALSIVATATDADGGDVLTYTTGTLPSGASWTAGTRTFAWTPDFTQSGSYVVRFIVTDNGSPNMNDYEDVTITVNDVVRYFLGRK
jgi:hypothetical protein